MINEILILAIINVESAGNDAALGDWKDGMPMAWGCMQIHEVMVEDCNRILGRDAYVHNDALNRDKSIEMFRVYTNHYCNSEKRIGREGTDEDRARCWNGGPLGYRKEATKVYWSKVLIEMDRLEGEE